MEVVIDNNEGVKSHQSTYVQMQQPAVSFNFAWLWEVPQSIEEENASLHHAAINARNQAMQSMKRRLFQDGGYVVTSPWIRSDSFRLFRVSQSILRDRYRCLNAADATVAGVVTNAFATSREDVVPIVFPIA